MHLGPVAGQFQHFLIADFDQLPSLRHQAGVRSIDALNIGIYFAPLGAQSGGQGHGCGVRAAPAQSGHVQVLRGALEPGDHDKPSKL